MSKPDYHDPDPERTRAPHAAPHGKGDPIRVAHSTPATGREDDRPRVGLAVVPMSTESPTGRAPSDPALQNIPLRTEVGRAIAAWRERMQPTAIDYASLEHRIAAAHGLTPEQVRDRNDEKVREFARTYGITGAKLEQAIAAGNAAPPLTPAHIVGHIEAAIRGGAELPAPEVTAPPIEVPAWFRALHAGTVGFTKPFESPARRACTEKAIANLDRAAAYVRARTSFADPEAWHPRDPLPKVTREAYQSGAWDRAITRRHIRGSIRTKARLAGVGIDAAVVDDSAHRRAFFLLPHGQIYRERLAACADSARRVKHWQHFGIARAVLRMSVAPEVLPTMIARGMV